MPLPSVYAYVDETGDLGAPDTPGASPVLGMACILVDDQHAEGLRDAVRQLRADFGVADGRIMSWKRHLANHERRVHAAETLALVPGLRVVYVYTDKNRVVGDYVRERGALYNYVAGKAYKSILWAARYDFSGKSLHTRFGHVRGFDHDLTRNYFNRVLVPDAKVPTHIEAGLRWVDASQFLESQAADLYAGFLRAAVWPDAFGRLEGGYLLRIWGQVRTGSACKIPLGFMSMPSDDIARELPWWPCECGTCKNR